MTPILTFGSRECARMPRFCSIVLLTFAVLGGCSSAARAQRSADAPTHGYPPQLVNFEPAPAPPPKNPVFTAAGPGHWDVKIRERGWIIREGDAWHLWYTGYDG